LPGAMELLAKSMGKPVTALDEMLKKGEIITKDVMPAFAKEVELAFGIAADQTDTLTAAQNKMFTAIEVAATRIMEGGIGEFIKTLFKTIGIISQYLGSLVQDNYQNQVDYNNRLKVESEKNVLYEIELKRKQYKEIHGIELSAQDAARAILEDEKTGEAAFFDWYKGQLKENEESANSVLDRIIRGAHKAFGTIGDVALSPIKLATAMVKDALAPLTGAEGNAMVKLFEENWKKRGEAINKYSQAEVEATKARIDKLKEFEQTAIAETNALNEEASKERDKKLKDKYQKELQVLELQERIRRLYAQANIENEHERSQELLKIAINFNNKKLEVDKKYNMYAQFSQSEGSKELLKLTKNNQDLRLAESADFNSELRRNEDKYHQDAYDAAIKQYAKLEEEQKKAANKTEKIAKTAFEKELQTSEDSYSELIKKLEDARDVETQREGLSYKDRIVLFQQYTDLINQTWENRSKARNDITAKYAEKDLDEFAKMFEEIDKMYREDYENSIKRFDAQAQLIEANAETEFLAQKNRLRASNANEQELLLLDKQQNEERLNNRIELLQQQNIENKKYADMGVEDAQKAYDQNLADIKNLEEQKTAISLDYADQRKRYEIAVMKEAFDLGSQLVSQMMDLRSQQLDQELTAMQSKYDLEIEMANGNKQQIMAIEQRRRDEEKRIRKEQFEAKRAAAVADVIFKTAPIIAEYTAGIVTAPLAIIAGLAAAAQIGYILAQPVPEYRKGTRGKKHKGGPAIVGEEGVERVVTESGQVYYTPPTATLLDLPKGAQVIPNNLLDKQEIYYATNSSVNQKRAAQPNRVEGKLDEIGTILKGLPIHQINMDERGFEKYIRTERRTTKILNSRFPIKK
jgi:hypothetical protein